jgi:ferritin-like metal-binding protein YciE
MALKVHFTPRENCQMNIQTIEDLFVEQIQDLYDAEQRLVKALPKMAEKATNNELRSAFADHLLQTEGQVQRLEQVFAELGQDPAKETCEAMKGLIKEGEEMMDIKDPAIRDAALIAAANRVEHYEIAAYGTARTLATALGLSRSPSLLEQTLDEEKKADAKLTQIAEQTVNPQAAQPRTRTAR